MDIALQVQAKSTNTSKTKRSVSSAAQVATVIAQLAHSVSIATVTVATNASGVVGVQLGIVLLVRAESTKNKQQNKGNVMEIIFFIAIVFIGLVLRSNFQNIKWHSSEIDDLERRLKILEQKLEEKMATKSDLYNLEQKVTKPIDLFDPNLDIP